MFFTYSRQTSYGSTARTVTKTWPCGRLDEITNSEENAHVCLEHAQGRRTDEQKRRKITAARLISCTVHRDGPSDVTTMRLRNDTTYTLTPLAYRHPYSRAALKITYILLYFSILLHQYISYNNETYMTTARQR
jgi:hypothetical protein